MQSAQAGQLDVAQSLHTAPTPQLSQKPSHAGAHWAVAKMHTPPGQSWWSTQLLGPVVELVVVLVVVPLPVAVPLPVVVPLLVPPLPSSPSPTTDFPPQAATRPIKPAAIHRLVITLPPSMTIADWRNGGGRRATAGSRVVGVDVLEPLAAGG